jgi:hypothetical protein
LNLAGTGVQLMYVDNAEGATENELLLTQILGPRVIISQVSMRRQDFIPQLYFPRNQKRDFLKDIQKRVKNKLF